MNKLKDFKLFSISAMVIILITILLSINTYSITESGNIKLLAVSETEEGYIGQVADLRLEIREGSGRVFIDTYPLTKIDTQVTTRIAKEVACKFLDFECFKYDFIYTITANSPIVGGPSAGAATTLLTISLLDEAKLKEDVLITGTINSGGFIGPVGGLLEKLDAAKSTGGNKILIPYGENMVKRESNLKNQSLNKTSNNTNQENKIINLTKYGEEKGIEVIEIYDIYSALNEFTDKKYEKEDENYLVPEIFVNTMKNVSELICNRANETKTIISNRQKFDFEYVTLWNDSNYLLLKAENASFENKTYSRASYCFGAGVKLQQINLMQKNMSEKEWRLFINTTLEEILKYENEIDNKEKNTITDLQVYMIVKERLNDAKDSIKESQELAFKKRDYYNVAYSVERYISAKSWSEFFNKGEGKYKIDKDAIIKGCENKISEAESRLQYVGVFFETSLSDASTQLKRALENKNNKEYELCIFDASKAKAQADTLIGLLGVDESKIDNIITAKSLMAKSAISRETKKRVLPVLSHSYVEYAESLKNDDKYSTLLFLEYAIELASMDEYFSKESNNELDIKKIGNSTEFNEFLKIFAITFFAIIFGFIFGIYTERKNKKNYRLKRVKSRK